MAGYRRISLKQEEARYKKQRSELLFNNDTLSDVKFVVRAFGNGESPDGKRSKIVIPAHKFVLSVSSPVFFSMFCGEMAESREQIDLPDCEYEGMLELLRYFYTDEVSLNENNVMQVLYVAEKYLVPCLAKECVKFLKTNLDSSNVFCVLKHAEQYKKEDLLGLCWNLIDKKTGEALSSSDFPLIERSLLEQVVERSTLDIKEIELFKAVDRWAEKECERQNLTVNGSAKRQVLGEKILKNIRFPVMEESDFMEVVLDSKMLTPDEISNMMNYLSCTLTSPVGFLEAERSSCLRCCRCKGSLESAMCVRNGLDTPHVIEITVDKDIVLYGVGMFGNRDADYSITLKITNVDGSVLATKCGAYTSSLMEPETEYLYDGFLVLFDVPLTLNKGIKYGFKATLDGIYSRVETSVVNDVVCAGVTFNFKDPRRVHDDEEEDACYGWPNGGPTGQLAELFFKVKT